MEDWRRAETLSTDHLHRYYLCTHLAGLAATCAPGASLRRPPVLPAFLGSLGPLASAFAVTGLASGRAGVRELLGRLLRWNVPAGWHLLAWFGPAALYAVGAVVLRVVWGQWPGRWPPSSISGLAAELCGATLPPCPAYAPAAAAQASRRPTGVEGQGGVDSETDSMSTQVGMS